MHAIAVWTLFRNDSVNRAGDDQGPEATAAERYNLISRIADDVAHELKNPLNSIVINLEVLRSRVKAGQTDAALDRAEVIEAELRRLQALLEAMLRLLRPERGGGELVALADVLEDIAALAQAQARVTRKDLTIEAVPEDMIVRARRDALRFTLLHLIEQALRAVPENAAGVRIAAARRADAIALRIEAEGADASHIDGLLDGVELLLAESGVVDSECRQLENGSACTLLLMQPGDVA